MIGGRLRVGVLLPTRGALMGEDPAAEAQGVLRLAQRAEAAGCDSVWVGDSLTAKPRLDPLITLAAVAARTERVRLGTAVLLGALYQPVLLARAAASLDILSGGRLTLAMGVGGAFSPELRREWAAAGTPAKGRAGRLSELVQLLPQLWSGAPVTFQGKHFQLEDVALEPRPLQQPGVPVWLACHQHTGSEVQYRRAARWSSGIISITDSPEQFTEVWERVAGYAREYGRDPETMARAFYMTVNVNQDREAGLREADAFITRYYGQNWWGERWGPFGPAQTIVERIRAYAAAGAQEVIVRFAAFDQAAQMDRFEQEVLPALRT